MERQVAFAAGFLAVVAAAFLLTPYLGRDFFPSVDSGQILMHMRLRVGTRVEESAKQFSQIEAAIRSIVPPGELDTLVDNIGMPVSGINLSYNNTGVIGSQDGDMQIKLAEGHRPSRDYVRALREQLPRRFPGVSFAFLPADIVSQILNFGARRRSTCKSPARTCPRISITPISCCAGCAMCPASPTRAFNSRPPFPSSTSTSTAPAPSTSA